MKALISAIHLEFETLKKEISSKNQDFINLQSENAALKKQISLLKSEVNDLNAYGRRECAIFSGNVLPPGSPNENCAKAIAKVVTEKLLIPITENDVSTAHRLGPKSPGQGPDNRKVIAKFCRRDLKNSIMLAARKKRYPGLYVNECLTEQNRSLFYTLRKIKKAHGGFVRSVSTKDGRVYVYTKPSPDSPDGTRDVRHFIDSRETLEKFCQVQVKHPIETFLENWQISANV